MSHTNKMSRRNPNYFLSCPNPYILDTSTGLCVEPTPPGFSYVNGDFRRQCPPGMSMNDLGVCIRPVMTRESFVNEASIRQTILGLSNPTSVIFGQYDPLAFDMEFSQSVPIVGVDQILVSPNSEMFLAGQASTTTFGLSTLTLKGSQQARAVGEDIPTGIFKMIYTANASQSSQLYMLGLPKREIFVADYDASQYKSVQSSSTAPPISLSFDKSAYSVAGLTDAYYVGSYNTLNTTSYPFTYDQVGALQSGLDSDSVPVSSLTVPQRTSPADPASASDCFNLTYIENQPVNPFPQILTEVTDTNSRGFTDPMFSDSLGYIFSGYSSGVTAYAVRYLKNDPCVGFDRVPTAQYFTQIDLGVPAASGTDARIARFDVDSNEDSVPDTIYVFGSNDLGAFGNPLSFITENKVYTPSSVTFKYNIGSTDVTVQVPSASDLESQINALLLAINQALGSPPLLVVNHLTRQLTYAGSMVLKFANDSDAKIFGLTTSHSEITISAVATVYTNSNFSEATQYNGLSWDDVGTFKNRSLVQAMSMTGDNGNLQGNGVTAWSYEPINQSLVFAIGPNDPSSSYGAIQILEYELTPGEHTIPLTSQVISVEVHLWGAGGSSDPNSSGTGGAGAYVSGHLLKDFLSEDHLDVIVGSSVYGGGGNAARSSFGCGGGRTAIRVNGRDIVTAGGGGGSVGSGIGGAATSDTKQAENGLPLLNGGHGATSLMSGRGGTVYGDKRARPAGGSLGSGGNSTWTFSKSCAGGGGGGGGYYGGGAGSYLGYTSETNDLPCGGGGGSSYSQGLIQPTLYSGIKDIPASKSEYYQVGVARGGSAATNGLGGPGYAKLIVTKGTYVGGSPPQTNPNQIWAIPSGALRNITSKALMGSPTTMPKWDSVCVPLKGLPPGKIVALYTGIDGLIVAVLESTSGALYDQTSFVYWSRNSSSLTNAGCEVFAPTTDVPSLNNVRSIRYVQSINGSHSIMFIGDGVRIFTAPGINSVWTNPQSVSDENGHLLDSMAFTDAQYNESTTLIEMAGQPSSLAIMSLHKTNWTPRFANFYDALDTPSESCPYNGFTFANPGIVPGVINEANVTVSALTNTLFCIRRNTDAWVTLSIYNSSVVSGFISSQLLIQYLSDAMNSWLSTLAGSLTFNCILGPYNVLYMTIEGTDDIFQFGFDSTVATTTLLNSNLHLAAELFGFDPSVPNSSLGGSLPSGGLQSSWVAPGPIALVPIGASTSSIYPTPLTVPLEVNSVYAGSIYHVYAPSINFASGSGPVVACGGPILNPYVYDESKKIGVPFMGSALRIDFATDENGIAGWTLYNNTAIILPEDYSTEIAQSPIRSPTNILVSENGSSYIYAKSLFAMHETSLSNETVSDIASTCLDSYHVNTKNGSQRVMPANFSVNSSGTVNAAVSQFNDVQFYEYQSGNYQGFYLATGQFLWETNTVLSTNVKWPKTLQQLYGVAWVSLDGYTWTTLPIFPTGLYSGNVGIEQFWMVFSTKYIDTINYRASLITDQGLYIFQVDQLMKTVLGLFTTGPIYDFSDFSRALFVQPAARVGPFAAMCLNRDAVGNCRSCLNTQSFPITIPNIVGANNTVQPNFDTCISGFVGDNDPVGTRGYSAIEAAVDGYAITAYGGDDISSINQKPNPKISTMRQSFYDENRNVLMICPKMTDPLSTPASVHNNSLSDANQMACFIDPMMNTNNPSRPFKNNSGYCYVRLPTSTFDGSAYVDYEWQARNLNLVPYETSYKDIVCPSTWGIGGSSTDPSALIVSQTIYGEQGSNVIAKVTNKGLGGNDGPFYQNSSIDVSANWTPSSTNRAVLANGPDSSSQYPDADILNDFGYAKSLQMSYTGANGANPNLYKLSSFEFPFDGNMDLNGQNVLTIGRDPQVFEPGFRPLLAPGPSDLWPANPIPQEGFGIWYIRPNMKSSGNLIGMMNVQLGYGCIQMGGGNVRQTIPLYPVNNNVNVSSIDGFVYDTSNVNYIEGSWANFLPYNGDNTGTVKINNSGCVKSSYDPDVQKTRKNFAKWSTQNTISICLKNGNLTRQMRNTQTNQNFVNLVCLNLFRPRNWAFKVLDNTPEGSFQSEQPNMTGQYEFLIPDPFYVSSNAYTIGIVGIKLNQSNVSTSTTVADILQGVFTNAVVNNVNIANVVYERAEPLNYSNAFHYWTVQGLSSTLDIFVRVKEELAFFSSFTSDSAVDTCISNQGGFLSDFNSNPLTQFIWFDPTAQTTRCLRDMVMPTSPTRTVQIVLQTNGRTGSRTANSYSSGSIWIRYNYSVTFLPQSAPYNILSSTIGANNTNAISIFGVDGISVSNNSGFIPAKDSRGYNISTNWTVSTTMNVLSSDYDIEDNFSGVFLDPTITRSQNLLAQVDSMYGDPTYGFGLRIENAATFIPSVTLDSNNSAIVTDHGKVSFVRSIIDSQQRLFENVDNEPHYHKMSYITKYVPSTLQQYGVTTLMRECIAGIPQNILNPFKFDSCYYVQSIPMVTWTRSKPSSNVRWQAFNSTDFDLEAPGFWGRQSLEYIQGQTTNFFDSSGQVLSTVYSNPQIAGYEGIVEGTLSNMTNFRTLNSSQKVLSDSPSFDPLFSTNVMGPMLVNLADIGYNVTNASAPNMPLIRCMIIDDNYHAVAKYLTISVADFLATYIKTSVIGGSGYSGSALVTHVEFATIIAASLQKWLNITLYPTLYPASTLITVASEFNYVTDRPKLTFQFISPGGQGYTVRIFRLFFPSPISNWLGLQSVTIPMTDITAYDIPGMVQLWCESDDFLAPDPRSFNNSLSVLQNIKNRYGVLSSSWVLPTTVVPKTQTSTPLYRSLYEFAFDLQYIYDNDMSDPANRGIPLTDRFSVIDVEPSGFGCDAMYMHNNTSGSFINWNLNQRSRFGPFTMDANNNDNGDTSGARHSFVSFNGSNVSQTTSWTPTGWNGENVNWTNQGWSGSNFPTYSLVYEGNITNSIVFEGHQESSSIFGIRCNIQNVSWTTRLASSINSFSSTVPTPKFCSHYWGAMVNSNPPMTRTAYHADAYLTTVSNGIRTVANPALCARSGVLSAYSDPAFSSCFIPTLQAPCSLGNGVGLQKPCDVACSIPSASQQALNVLSTTPQLQTRVSASDIYSPTSSMTYIGNSGVSVLNLPFNMTTQSLFSPTCVWTVISDTYINIGSFTSSTSKNQTMGLYIYNWSELFDMTSSPTMSSLSSSPITDTNIKTYLYGTPYKIDDLYDTTAFSALGRSFKIDATKMSSGGLQINLGNPDEPVIVILAPIALTNADSGSFKTLSNTYSNSFSSTYFKYKLPQPVRICFTPILYGPISTFYGLDCSTANSIRAINAHGVKDFNGNVNRCIGKDVRQMYMPLPSNSTGQISNTIGKINPYQFHYVTRTASDWNSAQTKLAYYLPLAGTLVGDTIANVPQIIPNYNGLSLISEWTSTTIVQGETVPNFTTYCVDRSNVIKSGSLAGHPFYLQNLEQQRPSTLFVMICDVWRNTLRSSVDPVLDGANQGLQPSDMTKSTLPEIKSVDCMGPANYDMTDAYNNQYFGTCVNSLPLTTSASTPWKVSSAVWNPFTGGSSWNSLISTENAGYPASSTDYAFPPQMWFPTYQWALSASDSSNVSPTSVASNDITLGAGCVIVSCSDGTIRKMTLGTQFPVIESTNDKTFLNGDINETGSRQAYSYVWPGRLYNLTWWSDNWWCTADNAAIWTTAPVTDSNGSIRTEINERAIVPGFFSSIIQFRPLSPQEGNSHASKMWPTNEAHKYTVMKPITIQGRSVLLVSSIDGEYMIISQSNGAYKSATPANDGTSQYFDINNEAFVSDLIIRGDSVVVASQPVPIDPQTLADPSTAFQSMINESLSYTPRSDIYNGPVSFINGQFTWTSALEDSNVIQYEQFFPVPATLLPYSEMSTNLSNASFLGLIGTASFWNNGYKTGIQSKGLQQLVVSRSKSNDSMLIQFPIDLASLNVNLTYNYKTSSGGTIFKGFSIFALSHDSNESTFSDPITGIISKNTSLFSKSGVDMDMLTKAFFVIDSSNSSTSLGLQIPEPYNNNIFQYTGGGLLPPSGPDPRLISAIVSSFLPLWKNSIVWTCPSSGVLSASIPQHKGPLSAIIKNLNDKALDIFQNASIRRTVPLLANLVISDFSYSPEMNAFAITTSGPYGSTVPIISRPIVPFAALSPDVAFSAIEARFISSSVIVWNPYELKWYVAGRATHMPDFPNGDRALLRPPGISSSIFATATMSNPQDANANRLMLLSADLSGGLQNVSPRFQQVYRLVSKAAVTTLDPVSRWFDEISCFGVSPNIFAVGGSLMIGGFSRAVLSWRQNLSAGGNDLDSNWSTINLEYDGTVTAIKFVEYSWYFSVWNATTRQSSLYFASINFNAITPLDGWSSNSNVQITSIDAIVPKSKTCAPGFEPSPVNPSVCVKKCPTGYVAYGTVCAQACLPPFTETGVPNECLPDIRKARKVSPTTNGQAPDTAPPPSGPQTTIGTATLSSETLIISVFIALVLVFVLLIYKYFVLP